MRRLSIATVAVALVAWAHVHADTFDEYNNNILSRAIEDGKLKEVKELSADALIEASGAIPQAQGAAIVVVTNDGRHARLLVQPGRQKVGKEVVPILSIERYTTYREGTEKATQASGQNVNLFPGFRLSLDLGQVVPEKLGGDIVLVESDKGLLVQPVGKARLYLVTKHLEHVGSKKGDKFVAGENFETRYYNGSFKLYDDGRRVGTLKLAVDDTGAIKGAFYNHRDGQKYEVTGKLKSPAHGVQFTISWPRTEQQFDGYMFTGNGAAIAGTSKMQGREAGWYAVREE